MNTIFFVLFLIALVVVPPYKTILKVLKEVITLFVSVIAGVTILYLMLILVA